LIKTIIHSIEIVSVIGTCTSISFYFLCTWSAIKFLRKGGSAASVPAVMPPVSVLKPLKGTDPDMYESLRSHCVQTYPEYEIIFGVSDLADSSVPLVQRLQQEFPQIPIHLVVCKLNLGNNTKIGNLAQMLPEAHHEFLVVNDSDIRVPPDYLRTVVPPLNDSATGLVTCLYKGVAAGTTGSQLESLGIGTDFVPGVLAAWLLESGISFGLGSTLAFRHDDLKAVGGFEAVSDYLADDYEIGNRIADLGRKVLLSHTTVATYLPAYSFRGYLAHQLRWARTVRDSRPGGYLGLIFTFGLPWSALALLSSKGAPWAWVLFGFTLAARCLMAWTTGKKLLQDDQVMRSLWLLPLRDSLGFLIWIASLAGHTVSWRGNVFRLDHGKLVRIKS
jgi:ceramide glucosyltransferase